MTDEEWEAFYKVHTGAKSLRITLLPFPELCATLYDNSCATGSMRRSLAPRRPSSSSIDFETPTIHTENVHNQSEDDDNTTNQGLEGVSSTPPRARSPDVDQGRRNKKVKKTVDLSELEVDMRKAIANLAKDKNTGITIDDCHDKLKGLELETTDPMFGRLWFDMDNSEKLLFIMIVYFYLKYFHRRRLKRKRDNTSIMSGKHFTQELLEGNSRQCIELLRMSQDSFVRLCTHFKEKRWLKDRKHLSVEEQMAMFLMVVGHNQRFVVLKRRFQHSNQTIHKYFHEVLDKMMLFAEEVIRPTSFNPNPNIPGNNKRERRVFKGAVGAHDGTLVHAIVPVDQQNVYRVRGRGDCYQNVLAICDFNMIFTFVVAGWEGTTHDSRVLNEALVDPDFEFPVPHTDKYYLCDAAYKHTRGFMAPYRNVRYWLGDFLRRHAMNSKEKFNHAHAKLINVIERAFGVLKARFPILKRMTPFELDAQRDITIACFAIHNFIRKEGLNDDFFSEYDQTHIHEDENVQHDDGDNDDEIQPYGVSLINNI